MNRYYLILSLSLINYCLAANEYYTYDTIESTLHAWQDTFGLEAHTSVHYPEFGIIYELITIGESSQDQLPIYAVKLSANVQEREQEPKVLILGQCHAEEIYGVEIAMEIINQFLHPEQYSNNRPYLQRGLAESELWIIPTYNPEGLRVVHGYVEDGNEIQDVTYRKNKRDTNNNNIFDYENGIGGDTDGVDLNRNYDFNWFFGDTLLQGCSDCTTYPDHYDYYKGEYPESESEVQAIVNLAKEQKFLLSIAYHSSRSGNVDKNVVYPWAWEGKSNIIESPGFDVIRDLGNEIAGFLDYDYANGSSKRRGQAHDWFYRETGCIQYLIEVGYTSHGPNDPSLYQAGLLIEPWGVDPNNPENVIKENIEAFFHLLMKAAGRVDVQVASENHSYPVLANQVRGTITDAVTGSQIKGAIVNIPELEDEILKPRKTDSSGYYCRLLSPGVNYTLVASAFGYKRDTINIDNTVHSSSGPTTKNIQLSPSSIYELTFNMQLPDDENTDLQLIIINSFKSDTIVITQGEIINLPQDHYRLILTASGYLSQVFEIDLIEDIELSIDLLYEDVIWGEDPSGTWDLTEGLSIPLSSLIAGNSLIIEMNFRYELEWDYDYFIIDYIDENETTEIIKFTGDHYEYYTEYIPFTIPEGHFNGSLYFHLGRDNTIDYRGVKIDYIKIMKGSETPLTNTSDMSSFLPDNIQLHQNYPNPFNPATNIQFSVPNLSPVSISIYNLRGEFIEYLVNDVYEPGNYTMHLDAGDYSSGIYFYRLQTDNSVFTRKFIIIK